MFLIEWLRSIPTGLLKKILKLAIYFGYPLVSKIDVRFECDSGPLLWAELHSEAGLDAKRFNIVNTTTNPHLPVLPFLIEYEVISEKPWGLKDKANEISHNFFTEGGKAIYRIEEFGNSPIHLGGEQHALNFPFPFEPKQEDNEITIKVEPTLQLSRIGPRFLPDVSLKPVTCTCSIMSDLEDFDEVHGPARMKEAVQALQNVETLSDADELTAEMNEFLPW